MKDVWAAVKTMLAQSPVPEGFQGYALSEYEGLETACDIACFIDEFGKLGGALLNHFCGDLEQTKKALEYDYWSIYQPCRLCTGINQGDKRSAETFSALY